MIEPSMVGCLLYLPKATLFNDSPVCGLVCRRRQAAEDLLPGTNTINNFYVAEVAHKSLLAFDTWFESPEQMK